ncbi:MAG: DNA cytosine methyltransferase [Oscillospiraceae bacterium]|nr:DNA cytosine methyltransferase [Oscillospiraceae bacterium]
MFIALSEYAEKHCKSEDTISKKIVDDAILVLSLFSGCGGLDLGFEGDFDVLEKEINKIINPDWYFETGKIDEWKHLPKTRFHTIFANDIRQDAKVAWTNYFVKRGISKSTYWLDSIVDLVKAHKSGNKIFPENVDVVTGGFPCQDFSVAGKRLGFNSNKNHNGNNIESDTPSIESRGQLYIWMKEVISITQPKVFVAENVKGLANLADVKSVIQNDFRSIGDNGYLVVDTRVLHAADYGVPQSRERIVFIGFKKSALNDKALHELSAKHISSLYDPYPLQTHAYTKKGNELLPPVNLSQAFIGLSEPEKSIDKSQQKYSKAKYMGKHCQGQTEVNLNDIGPTIRSEHHGNIEYRRLSEEHGGKYIEELQNGLLERRLTIRECARIQTFPDDYEFIITSQDRTKSLSASDAYKIIGNAVPPLLSYHIAKRLEKNWELYFGGIT